MLKISKIAILIFVAAFAFSTTLVRFFSNSPTNENVKYCTLEFRADSSTADGIENILQMDARNAVQRSRNSYLNLGESFKTDDRSFQNFARAVEVYAKNSDSINVGGLPEDFQTNWKNHMRAWREYSIFVNKLKDSAPRQTFTQSGFSQTKNEYNQNIHETWMKVLKSAQKYGVDVHGF